MAKRVDAGAALYKKKGCYECHVNDAQGGPQGPRLGPNPIPLPRFTTYVRNPTGEMPPYTERVLSNQELADIYAFLQARPQPKPVASAARAASEAIVGLEEATGISNPQPQIPNQSNIGRPDTAAGIVTERAECFA